ncbi:hotdog fold thioesterase [Spongiibacter tropicus]|uniref:hotdog fold thioesterase n=1 Tax=Spongiibacter tropicus TaxID=454602 RepID=UPI003A98FE1C
MSLWKQARSVEDMNERMRNTLAEALDIRVEAIDEASVTASMPVDARTHQPMGILHGGASVALAETVGSMSAAMAAEVGTVCVGLDINANHLRKVTSGRVTGVAKPIHIGRTTQVWEIRIRDEADRDVCISRLTMAVIAGSL